MEADPRSLSKILGLHSEDLGPGFIPHATFLVRGSDNIVSEEITSVRYKVVKPNHLEVHVIGNLKFRVRSCGSDMFLIRGSRRLAEESRVVSLQLRSSAAQISNL
ncbi:hypothetical protein GUJ93_ZPchr0009g1421 [Zizania palustris]|uniref:Uncharacterized protein n=1 Tax=Zizania palustris TaxID=103762 RepID=A0A8J5RMS1_ZIZPA|nr:hypothetical protein GUJ93_ZPchr0009g1421 [Zizania palustris]